MADEEQLWLLLEGFNTWNRWRQDNPNVRVDLSRGFLRDANLSRADLFGAPLIEADLQGANLRWANLVGANLTRTDLFLTDLSDADLSAANLRSADLTRASLIRTNFTGANLTGCRVYGISAWDLKLDGAKQKDLIITPPGEPEITVDNLEVAQFIYLLLRNERIRHVIDTITSKVVLILGRFTPERKAVLDALREELRRRDYLPVLFDFDKPASKDLTGTIQTLANMARFVIADLTDPSSVPHELATVAPGIVVPVQPVLLEGQHEYAMFVDLKRRYHWVLEPHLYASRERLIADLSEHVIRPAAAKAEELRGVPPATG
jgi:Pentapeptide repeats (8 copies)